MTASLAYSDIYLDSSILVDAMFSGLPHFVASDAFCAQLADDGTHVYFSHILYLEVGEAVRRLATNQQLPISLREEYRLADWATDANVRKEWMLFGLHEMERLLDSFSEAYEIPFQHTLWLQSIDLIGHYGLRASDAAHVATALHVGLRVFATNDGDFRRVDMLDVRIVREGHDASTARNTP
jgi:predicted nucleic acid-binding protein